MYFFWDFTALILPEIPICSVASHFLGGLEIPSVLFPKIAQFCAKAQLVTSKWCRYTFPLFVAEKKLRFAGEHPATPDWDDPQVREVPQMFLHHLGQEKSDG